MKKILLMTAIAAMGLGGCDKRPEPLKIDNALTAEEIAAGRLTPEVMWKMSRAGGSSLSPDGRTLLYQQTDYNMAENRGVTTIRVEDMDSKTVTCLTDFTSNSLSPKWSADGRHIYFLSDRSGSMQVWRMNASGGDATQITGSGDGEGVPDVEGFGVSPDGKHIWWVQTVRTADRRSSDIYKDMDKSKARIYDDLMARHWDYWDEGEYRHIFVGELSKGVVTGGRDIMPDAQWDAPLAPYFDMAEIAWNNAGTMLAYTCKPLTGTAYAVSTDSDIFVYDLESGATQNICKPTNFNTGKPVNDQAAMVGYDKYPVWSPDDSKIAFLSQRRAGNESDKARLFVYDCHTAEMQDLTADFDYNAQNVVWSGNDLIYFIAPIEATHQICRVAPSVGEVEVITRGDHDINAFTMAGERIAAEMCTISMATEFFEINPEDGSLAQISAINKSVYDNIRMGEVQKRWVKTTDGKQMLTWVILPPDFDPSQKYPVLLYCQGGPQSVVSQFWSYRWNFQLMAAQGYIVVAPNRRGLPSFGQEWLDPLRHLRFRLDVRRNRGAVLRQQRLRRPLLGHGERHGTAFLRQLAAQVRLEMGHADPDHHRREGFPHPLHAVARSLHGGPHAGHSGAARGVRKRGASGLQTPELAGLEPRILRLARQVRKIADPTVNEGRPDRNRAPVKAKPPCRRAGRFFALRTAGKEHP